MITREQVTQYLSTLNIEELESIFKEHVEYTDNCIMEDTIYTLENTIDDLKGQVEYLENYKYRNGYYE